MIRLFGGGGGGGGSIMGLTSDGQAPGGIVVAGAETAGDSTAAVAPSFHTFYGQLVVRDTDGTIADADYLLRVLQQAAMQAGGTGLQACIVIRSGDISAGDYGRPVVQVHDATASAQPLLSVTKGAATMLQTSGAGTYVGGKLMVDAPAVHTIGVYSGSSLPVYDVGGVLIGWLPVYG